MALILCLALLRPPVVEKAGMVPLIMLAMVVLAAVVLVGLALEPGTLHLPRRLREIMGVLVRPAVVLVQEEVAVPAQLGQHREIHKRVLMEETDQRLLYQVYLLHMQAAGEAGQT